MNLAARLVERIRREGPLPFDRWMQAALYDPDGGFYARGGGAGRAGRDFITSPETGELFGVLVGRFLDRCWKRLGRPDPFVVVDAGAGPGTLAGSVLRARPACAPALRYLLVESSPALRAVQAERLPLEPPEIALGPFAAPEPGEAPEAVAGGGPVVAALAALPAFSFDGVVLANELLDNLPVGLVERRGGGWDEIRVGLGPAGGAGVECAGRPFVEVAVAAEPALSVAADVLAGDRAVPDGARLPVAVATDRWLAEVAGILRRGTVAVIDYADDVDGLLARGAGEWLRTYRAQARAGSPLDHPGAADVTVDVCLEALRRGAGRAGLMVVEETTQADWLAGLGLAELVEEARAAWHARSVPDLAALASRSRVHEADALTDPAGLGAHRVVTLGATLPTYGPKPAESRRGDTRSDPVRVPGGAASGLALRPD